MSDTPAAHGGAAPPPAPWSEAADPVPPEPERDGLEPAPEDPAATLEPHVPHALIAKPRPPVPQAVEAVDADDLSDLRRIWKVGRWLALMENDQTPGGNAAGAVRVYVATELGLPAATSAATEIAIIDGKPYLSARLLRILALRQGFRLNPVELTDRSCTAVLEDVYGHDLGRATYTMEDAERAGLAHKRNYQKDPQSMLWARAARRVLDFYAPNVLFGLPLASDPGTPGRIRDADLDFHAGDDPPFDDGGYLDDEGVPL